jgi:putative spermidine/putrescine transport system permease protein
MATNKRLVTPGSTGTDAATFALADGHDGARNASTGFGAADRKAARAGNSGADTLQQRQPRPPSAIGDRLWKAVVWGAMIFFLVNVLLLIATVAVNSTATRWFGTLMPQGFTLHWYAQAWSDFQLGSVLWVTTIVVGSTVVLSVVLGVPAAYALARVDFPGKRWAMLVFLLPMMVPPVTYGIPLATVMYKFGLAGTLTGVVMANLVPALPFVILVMTPFIEQIDPNLESAARIFGANTVRYFRYVLLPLLVPGMLAAGLLVLVRTIGMFELTYFTAGPSTQTLVVALYYAVFSTGVRAPQSIDAMAMIYMAITLVWVLIALQFVSPTQLVSRVKEQR